jgi:hypothetical protein
MDAGDGFIVIQVELGTGPVLMGRERSCFRVGDQETCTIYHLGIEDVREEGLELGES